MSKKEMIYAAIAAVAALLLYSWWKSRSHVLDASNSQQLSDLFDQLNPTVGGVKAGNTGFVGPAFGSGGAGPIVQNWIPLNKPGMNGQSPPIIDHYPGGGPVSWGLA
jgi:hypothetical protein